MRLRAGSVALSVALLAGCGSTVQVRGTATTDPGGQGLGTTGSVGSTTSGGSAGGATGSTTGASGTTGVSLPGSGGTSGGSGSGSGSAAGGTGAGTSGTSTGSPLGGTTGAAAPVSGRGFTKTTISIGVGTASDYNSTAGNLGVKGVGYEGDVNVWFKAVVDDINASGGILGRKVVLVKHDFSTIQVLQDPAGANQAACATWTQDKPVAAVLFAGFIVEDTILSCLGKVGVPLVYPGAGLDFPLHYRSTYQRFPLFFNLAQMVGERYDRLSVQRLHARGFFSPWDTRNGKPGTAAANPVKIGLIGYDDSDGATQQASRKRELAKYGLKATTTVECPRALSSNSSCAQSAVLKFATAGVTHVFGAAAIFMNNAQQQNYHPRYFIQASAAAIAANEPAAQLNGSMAENYVPFNDVDTSEYPGDPTPATTKCKSLMRKAGQGSGDPSTLYLQMSVCDEFFFLAAAGKRSGNLTGAGLRAGFEGLGSSVQSALTWTSFLSPSEHTSAAALRDLAYDSAIGRYRYVSTTNYGDK